MRSHATPRARSIEANLQLQRRIKSLVGARQSSQPPTLETHTRATQAALTFTVTERHDQWGRDIHARYTRLASGISIDSEREGDARRGEASTNEGQKMRNILKWLSKAALGIPPPHLQMQT